MTICGPCPLGLSGIQSGWLIAEPEPCGVLASGVYWLVCRIAPAEGRTPPEDGFEWVPMPIWCPGQTGERPRYWVHILWGWGPLPAWAVRTCQQLLDPSQQGAVTPSRVIRLRHLLLTATGVLEYQALVRAALPIVDAEMVR